MGVDFGFKRIGLAVGEQEFGIISPRPSLAASGTLKGDAEAIAAVAKVERAEAVVVGLPIEETGDEGKMARICRTLSDHLRSAGLTVHLIDESMTSVQAEEGLRQHDLKASQRRKLRDGEAAALILERYLNEQAAK